MTIETPNDWWKVLDHNWTGIFNILQLMLPMYELAYEEPGNPKSKILPIKGVEQILKAKEDRDWEICLKYLNAAWWAAPDKPSIHAIPSWDVLCDLCSESWAVEPVYSW